MTIHTILCLLVLLVVLVGLPLGPAMAQPSLEHALLEWSHRTGLQLIVRSELLHEVPYHGADPERPALEQLEQLLAPSGLHYRVLNPHTVVLLPPPSDPLPPDTAQRPQIRLEELVVTGSYLHRQHNPWSHHARVLADNRVHTPALSLADHLAQLSIQGGNDHYSHPLNQPDTLGQSSTNLRNLGPGANLILFDGLRQPSSPAINLEGVSSVNVNLMLPRIALRQVEILKDSGSALYGSDAIAGVINLIPHDSHEGTTVQVEQSWGRGGGDLQRIGILSGRQSPEQEWLLAYQYLHQQALPADRRAFTRNTAISSFGQPGTFILPDGQREADPACGVGSSRLGSDGTCLFPYASYYDLISAVEQHELLLRIGQWWSDQTFVRLTLGYGQQHLDSRVSPSFPLTAAPILIPVDNPANHWGVPVQFQGRLLGVGSSAAHIEHHRDRSRLHLSLEQDLNAPWMLSSHLQVVQERLDYRRPDVHLGRLQSAIDGHDGRYWNPLYGATNDPALIRTLIDEARLHGRSLLSSADLLLNGSIELLQVPLELALGSHWRREEWQHNWNSAFNQQQLANLNGAPDFHDRRDFYALFSEAIQPLPKNWTLRYANRLEWADDQAPHLDQHLGLHQQWHPHWQWRLGWSSAYRSPAPVQRHLRQSTQRNLYDPWSQTQTFRQIEADGNPNLAPETAQQWTLGVQYQSDQQAWGLDLWQIDYEQVIVKERASVLVDAAYRDSLAGLTDSPALRQVQRDPITGELRRVQVHFVNAARIETRGADLYWRAQYKAWHWGAELTYVDHFLLQEPYQTQATDRVGQLNASNVAYSLPRWRAQTELQWQHADWSWRLQGHYQHHYRDEESGSRIHSFSRFDSHWRWQPEGRWALEIGVLNLLDRAPPSADLLLGFDATQHDPRGRQLYLQWQYHLQ